MVLDVEKTRSGEAVVYLGFAQGNRRARFDERAWELAHPGPTFDNLVSRANMAREAGKRAKKQNLLAAAARYEAIASEREARAEEILRLVAGS